ncbi:MAG TPA: hypothetical protein PKZ42_15900 [Syntrophales bacterium]|nr:hypothetical protein [Syntrophales bacterium]
MTATETVYQENVIVDRCEFNRNIGFVKGFLELLYGCYAGNMTDDLSGNLLYMIGDAEDYLKKSLDLLEGAKRAHA